MADRTGAIRQRRYIANLKAKAAKGEGLRIHGADGALRKLTDDEWQNVLTRNLLLIVELRDALEPFVRMVNAPSLQEALAHISRDHLRQAHDAFEKAYSRTH